MFKVLLTVFILGQAPDTWELGIYETPMECAYMARRFAVGTIQASDSENWAYEIEPGGLGGVSYTCVYVDGS